MNQHQKQWNPSETRHAALCQSAQWTNVSSDWIFSVFVRKCMCHFLLVASFYVSVGEIEHIWLVIYRNTQRNLKKSNTKTTKIQKKHHVESTSGIFTIMTSWCVVVNGLLVPHSVDCPCNDFRHAISLFCSFSTQKTYLCCFWELGSDVRELVLESLSKKVDLDLKFWLERIKLLSVAQNQKTFKDIYT